MSFGRLIGLAILSVVFPLYADATQFVTAPNPIGAGASNGNAWEEWVPQFGGAEVSHLDGAGNLYVNSCVGCSPSLAGMPFVATNAILAVTPIASAPSVLRLDYAAGVGASAIVFNKETGTCAANSRVNDGGSCTNSSDGNSWVAQFPPSGADAREWGVIVTTAGGCCVDTSTTLQAAVTWVATHGSTLLFSPGVIYNTVVVAATLPSGVNGVKIRGAGNEVTVLRSAIGSGGLQLTFSNTGARPQEFSVSDMTFATEGSALVNPASGLAVLNGATTFFAGSQSDVTNVTFRGVTTSDCWANGFFTDTVSQIGFFNVNLDGCENIDVTTTPNGANGIVLFGGSNFGIIYNLSNLNCRFEQWCVYYGANIQGVTISQSNFTPALAGVFTASSEPGIDGLSIVASQFGFGKYGLELLGFIPNLNYVSNIEGGPEGTMIYIPAGASGIISANTFTDFGILGSPVGAGEVAIVDQGTVAGDLVITANQFNDYGVYNVVPIQLGSSAGLIDIFANGMIQLGGTVGLVSGGSSSPTTPNRITGANFAFGSVSGAVDNGAGMVRLTVNTAGFVNGEIVAVSGVGGIGGIGTSTLNTPIIIIDGTHMDLEAVAFSGTYTSGGFVSWVP